MVELVGVHGLEEAHLVYQFREVRQVLRHPGPRLPVLLKRRLRPQHLRHALDEGKPLPLQQRLGAVLPIQLLQVRLEVEQLQLRRRPRHMQENH